MDGDGIDELLALQKTNNNDWWSLLKFDTNNQTWTYKTTSPNYSTNWGNNWLGGWGIQNIDEFFPMDMDGDGKDELLALQKTNNNDWTSVLSFNVSTGLWTQIHSNQGNNFLGSWGIQSIDEFQVLKSAYNMDMILSVQKTNSNSNWSAVSFFNGTWSSLSNNGNGKIGSNSANWWNIQADDIFRGIDVNGDGMDELLCIRNSTTQTGWALYEFDGMDWLFIESSKNSPFLSSWNLAGNHNHSFLTGKMENVDMDYLLCFQKTANTDDVAAMYYFNEKICSPITGIQLPTQKPIATQETNIEVSIEENNQSPNFKVYPNPTYNMINLETKKAQQFHVKILDSRGQLVYSTIIEEQISSLDLSSYPSGVYFISLQDDNETHSIKVIKY